MQSTGDDDFDNDNEGDDDDDDNMMMMVVLVNLSLRAEHWFKGRSLLLSITPTDCRPF